MHAPGQQAQAGPWTAAVQQVPTPVAETWKQSVALMRSLMEPWSMNKPQSAAASGRPATRRTGCALPMGVGEQQDAKRMGVDTQAMPRGTKTGGGRSECQTADLPARGR